MSNPIKYSTGTESLALKKGNFYIGTGDVGKGPTSSTGYYNGISPPSGGYTIYLNKETGGPSIYTASNDAQLISLTNSIAGQSYTTANECLVYFAGQTDKVCLNMDYENIVTDELVFVVDAGFTPSYPKIGTTWYDMNVGLTGTLNNGPTFSTDNGGILVFDGSDDNARFTFTSSEDYIFTSSAMTLSTFAMQTATSTVDGYVFDLDFVGYRLWGSNNSTFRAVSPKVYGAWQVGPTYNFNLNQWYNLTVTMLDDGSTNNVKVYINGQFQAQSTFTLKEFGFYSEGARNNRSFRMCSHYGGHSNRPMKLGNFYKYNKILTPSEVLQNYNAQKGRFGL
jgi:hypothetical protein